MGKLSIPPSFTKKAERFFPGHLSPPLPPYYFERGFEVHNETIPPEIHSWASSSVLIFRWGRQRGRFM